jgi:hypothetical protein
MYRSSLAAHTEINAWLRATPASPSSAKPISAKALYLRIRNVIAHPRPSSDQILFLTGPTSDGQSHHKGPERRKVVTVQKLRRKSRMPPKRTYLPTTPSPLLDIGNQGRHAMDPAKPRKPITVTHADHQVITPDHQTLSQAMVSPPVPMTN